MRIKHFLFFEKKNFRMVDKKSLFFKIANSRKIFAKISWIGPWVSRIDWCERHWYGSTYMVVRLSDISSKTGKICIFSVFRPFLSLCRTASRLFRLSQINVLRINQFYQPKDQSIKFSRIFFENWRFWKISFVLAAILKFFFSKKNFFFASFSC